MMRARGRRTGGIIGGLLKLIGLAVVGLIALGMLATVMTRGPQPAAHPAAPSPTAAPAGPDAAPIAPAPAAAAEPVEDSDPLPGEPVPEAGELVTLANDHGLKVVSIVRGGKMVHLPNPTRVRVITGQPKRCKWGAFEVAGVYEVEVLDGEQAGVRGFASPSAMKFDRPLSDEEKTRADRQRLIDRRKAKRNARQQ